MFYDAFTNRNAQSGNINAIIFSNPVVKKSRLIKIGAILSILVFIAVLLAYTEEFPPISVVASESMTHSDYWTPDTINVGDIVFVKKVTVVPDSIITYVVGRETGFQSYGEYGNVILYRSSSGLTIIHRAMFYLSWNGSQPVIQGYHNQSWIKVTRNYVLINDAGYSHRNLVVYISKFENESGFITMGDHNLAVSDEFNSSLSAYIAADQNVGITSAPVNSSNIVGVAFWDIPWFGLIKLNILRLYGQWPEYNEVAKDSYDFLFLSLFIIFGAILFPYKKVGYSLKKYKTRRR